MKEKWMSSVVRSAFTLLAGLGLLSGPQLFAQSFNVVHNFTDGSDGGSALSGLTIDHAGNLYGTASAGGRSGAGVVYKVDTQGNLTTVYNFAGGSDGATPESRPVMDRKGDLYGTTGAGGSAGAGTVFRVTKSGKETILYSFAGGTDGASPVAGLARDKYGNLYGTTTAGGAYGNGTVFKLSPPRMKGKGWTEKILYSFNNSGDGTVPVAGVTLDKKGNVYGAASVGGTY